MPYRFTGDNALLYTQYRDLDTDRPLFAVPEGEYDMAPVGGLNMTIPPSDGRWDPPPAPPEGDAAAGAGENGEPGGPAGDPPPPLGDPAAENDPED